MNGKKRKKKEHNVVQFRRINNGLKIKHKNVIEMYLQPEKVQKTSTSLQEEPGSRGTKA